MKQCEFCGASLPAEAGFCGVCGHVSQPGPEQATYAGDVPTVLIARKPDENTPTMPLGGEASSDVDHDPFAAMRPMNLAPLEGEDEEEERRRRAALLGLGLPLLVDQQAPGHIPTMQGAPQMAHVPTLSGTPSAPGAPSFPGQEPPRFPPHTGHHHHHHHGHHGGSQGPGTHPGNPGGSTGGTSGCLTIGLILVAAVVLVLASIVGLGLTVWTPALALSGSSTVAPGGALSLHGNHFLPNSNVTLTLDNNIPLLFAQRAAPTDSTYARVDGSPQNMGQALSAFHSPFSISTGRTLSAFRSPQATNIITVGGNGSFSVTIAVSRAWSAGQHTIHAIESPSHRNASLTFTIGQPATPTPTPTSTSTLTPTATSPTLSCASPNVLLLGPVSELSSQIAIGTVTLCTGGSGTLTWNAGWDKNQAAWLQLPTTSGTIQAPNQASVTINASPARLRAGTYTATLTFTGQESNTTQTVMIQLTVQAGCVNETPPRMVFSGVAGISDPAPQKISITNCALTSDWFAKTANNSNWLTISPSQGTLRSNTTSSITVTASNVKAGLKAGSYQDTIVITLGSQTIRVSILLNVQPPPTLSASPPTIDVNSTACIHNNDGSESCPVTLTNNSGSAPLKWSWSADNTGASVQPGGATIAPGGQETITIVIAKGVCTNITFTFTGPGNQVQVTWTCQIIG